MSLQYFHNKEWKTFYPLKDDEDSPDVKADTRQLSELPEIVYGIIFLKLVEGVPRYTYLTVSKKSLRVA